MRGQEQFILTVSENGFGKRTSSYEYRITGRGGKGIVAMVVNDRNGPLVASFPVERHRSDHAGHRRRPADPLPGRRRPHRRAQHAGRARVQDRAEDEKVVSVERIPDDGSDAGEAAEDTDEVPPQAE